jgi:hypothetical protein
MLKVLLSLITTVALLLVLILTFSYFEDARQDRCLEKYPSSKANYLDQEFAPGPTDIVFFSEEEIVIFRKQKAASFDALKYQNGSNQCPRYTPRSWKVFIVDLTL